MVQTIETIEPASPEATAMDAFAVMDLALGYVAAQALHVAATLGIASLGRGHGLLLESGGCADRPGVCLSGRGPDYRRRRGAGRVPRRGAHRQSDDARCAL